MGTQERWGHGNQGINVGVHMYVAQGSSEEEAGVPPQHEALGSPIITDLVVEAKPAKRQQ